MSPRHHPDLHALLILISTHSSDDFRELLAGGPARGFLTTSDLSAQAIREVFGNGGTSAPP
jgi:two-component system, NarL family, nitrate/nitrite response regulator NarL